MDKKTKREESRTRIDDLGPTATPVSDEELSAISGGKCNLMAVYTYNKPGYYTKEYVCG